MRAGPHIPRWSPRRTSSRRWRRGRSPAPRRTLRGKRSSGFGGSDLRGSGRALLGAGGGRGVEKAGGEGRHPAAPPRAAEDPAAAARGAGKGPKEGLPKKKIVDDEPFPWKRQPEGSDGFRGGAEPIHSGGGNGTRRGDPPHRVHGSP